MEKMNNLFKKFRLNQYKVSDSQFPLNISSIAKIKAKMMQPLGPIYMNEKPPLYRFGHMIYPLFGDIELK